MNNSCCPLGFECLPDESLLVCEHYHCINAESCYTWIQPWELPYWQEYHGLIVNFVDVYNSTQRDLSENPITSKYDWRQYFAEYGFAEAVALPYFFRASNSTMMVFIANDHICREEIQKAGYANAVSLPLQNRKEYYSDDTYEGFNYLEVDLFFCGDEAINALNAGYANAIELLPVSLDEQRVEHFYGCEND